MVLVVSGGAGGVGDVGHELTNLTLGVAASVGGVGQCHLMVLVMLPVLVVGA